MFRIAETSDGHNDRTTERHNDTTTQRAAFVSGRGQEAFCRLLKSVICKPVFNTCAATVDCVGFD